ncbi:hypothetical protein [Nonomuraea sp. NPDC049646]|uniref:hypothetical protein n=1 Tax=unclassified Nonomuraea TaxID=2593643 RepID=UPI00378823B3
MKMRSLVAAAMLAMTLSACQLGPAPSTPSGSGPISSSAPVAPVSASAPPDQVLAGREGSVEGRRFRIDVVQLVRRDRFVNLTFTLALTGGDGWQVHNAFSAVPQANPTIDGVYLIDTVNAKKHLVALDSAGGCVCSRTKDLTLNPGDTAVFSATFAAPPEGVKSLDVHIPHAGTLADVPLS